MTTVSSTASTTSTASSASTTTTSGTKTTTSVDWDALIAAEVAEKTAPATTITTKITANEAKISAYQNLQTLLGTVATATDTLSDSIINSLSTSVYGTRSATITTTGDVSASSALSMSISNGAALGDHTLTISQIAEAHKVLGTAVADQTAELGYAGTFSLGLEGGTSADISITSGMSLEDVVSAINAQTSTTNVQASIIQVSSSDFEMVLSATEDNADIVTSSTTGDDVMNKLGITDSSGDFSDVLQVAQAAKFTLDGVSLTRDTNDITDVLSGVTFNLLQTTPTDATVDISIEADTSTIETALQTFVTAYNAMRDYVSTQQTLDSDGTVDSSSVLFGDGTMRQTTTQLEQALNTTIGGLSLSDLGLSFTDTNDLELDTTTLENTLTTNLDGAISLLANRVTPASSSLGVVNIGTSVPADFTLDLTVDDSGNLTSASVGGDSSLFTVSGDSILGNTGTIYAGMAFTYTGSTSQSIAITTSAGIAAQINSISNSASDTSTGTLQSLITNLQSQDDSMSTQVDDINSRAAIYKAMLTTEYASYQSAISTANSMLDYLSALLNDSGSS
ncbi:MAG: Flagellar hook-associated protein [Tardiphaga sp.]|nr:Flagellar hook-associated protein [Tardiphaga sp.]